jgi:hypothetical protein
MYMLLCRYARSVPTVCPLAETKHPLYPVGAAGQHTVSKFTCPAFGRELACFCAPQKLHLRDICTAVLATAMHRHTLQSVTKAAADEQPQAPPPAQGTQLPFLGGPLSSKTSPPPATHTHHHCTTAAAAARTPHLLLPGAALLLFCCLHPTDSQDGSAQRSQWHGWGDVTLLKQDGYEGRQQQ